MPETLALREHLMTPCHIKKESKQNNYEWIPMGDCTYSGKQYMWQPQQVHCVDKQFYLNKMNGKVVKTGREDKKNYRL
jgi:hypothetical protein